MWRFEKEILGWVVNGKQATITLPTQKCNDLCTLLKNISKKKQVSLNSFQKLSGRLQHASFALPGGKGLFSPIQRHMVGSPSFINITPELKLILADWKYFIRYLSKNPTSVFQLVQDFPAYLGYTDACRLGAGGIWTSKIKHLHPIFWQLQWPEDIQHQVVSDANPSGTITINDLELAALVLHWLVLERLNVVIKHQHVGLFCDNMSAVMWAYKMRTSRSLIAGRLLCLLGLRIHATQASHLMPLHIAGENNQMADVTSRAFKDGKFADANINLLSYFNLHFPLSQEQSWREFHFLADLALRVILCLRGVLSPLGSLLRLPKNVKNTGATGAAMHAPVESTPTLPTRHLLKETSSSAGTLTGSGRALTVTELKSEFKASRQRFRPCQRPYNWLENRALSTAMQKRTTNLLLQDVLKGTDETTLHLSHN